MSEFRTGFRVDADVGGFERGMIKASESVKGLKHQLHEFGAGKFGHLLGLTGVIEGFKLSIEHARKTRDELEKLGLPVDKATASVAAFGDEIEGVGNTLMHLGVSTLSIFTGVGVGIRQIIQGTTDEMESAARRALVVSDEATKKTLANIQQRKDATPQKVEDAIRKQGELRKQYDEIGYNNQDKLNQLRKEENNLLSDFKAYGNGSLEQEKVRVKILENQIAQGKIQADEKKKGFDDQKEQAKQSIEDSEKLKKLKFDALPPEKQLAQLKTEQAGLEYNISEDKRFHASSTKDEIALQENVNEQKKISEELDKRSAEAAKSAVEAEEKRLRIAQKFKETAAIITNGGDAISSASDATLEEVARRSKAKLLDQQLNGGYGIGQDISTAITTMELNRVNNELRRRQDLSQTGSMLGEDAARRSYDGNPYMFEQYYSQIKGTQSEVLQTNNLLKQLLEKFKQGIPVFDLTKPTSGNGP